MTPEAERSVFAFGEFIVDPAQRVLLSAPTRQPLPLSPRVFDTLVYLCTHPGQLLEKSALMSAVWPDVVVEENSLSQSISVLRRVLGENPGEHRYIATIPGRGYQFVADVRVLPRGNGAAGPPHGGGAAPGESIGGKLDRAWATQDPHPFRTTGDERGDARTSVPVGKTTGRVRAPHRGAAGGAVLALVGAAALIGAAGLLGEGTEIQMPSSAPARFVVDAPELALFGWVVALTPDGRTLVYARGEGDSRMLYRRDMDTLESRPIRGTEGGTTPFFSPDSQWLGFFADGRLKKVALAGGDPIVLAEWTPSPAGATWGADGVIVWGSIPPHGLMRVSSQGGVPQALPGFDFAAGDTNQWAPHFLLDGKTLLFVHNRLGDATDRRQVAVERLDTGERRVLFNGTNPHYVGSGHSASGHIVFMRQESDALWAVPFDPERLEVTGEALPVLAGVRIHTPNAAHFAVSRDGTLAYVPGTMQSRQGRLIWKDASGETRPFVDRPEGFPRSPRLSPDGTLLAADFAPPGEPADPSIWIHDVARERAPLRLTLWGGSNRLPTWTPDGRRIAFQWTRASHGIENGLFLLDVDGAGQSPEFLGVTGLPLAFANDGSELVYAKDNGLQRDLWVVSIGDRATQPLIATAFNEDEAALSPDGKHIAFVSDRTGRPEVYVQPYGDRGTPLRVSQGGGHEPVWSRDGARLYYQSGSRLLAATVSSTESGLQLEPPQVLFEGGFLPYTPTITLSERTYDVAPDGRFVMVDLSEAQADEIVVVQQWAQEVARMTR